jgi:hypothetical protein
VKRRRRPNRSPRAAPVINSTAKLSVYALTVHSSCSIEAPRSSRIVLSAVVTTSASSATINDPTEARARTQFWAELDPIFLRLVLTCAPGRRSGVVVLLEETPAAAGTQR